MRRWKWTRKIQKRLFRVLYYVIHCDQRVRFESKMESSFLNANFRTWNDGQSPDLQFMYHSWNDAFINLIKTTNFGPPSMRITQSSDIRSIIYHIRNRTRSCNMYLTQDPNKIQVVSPLMGATSDLYQMFDTYSRFKSLVYLGRGVDTGSVGFFIGTKLEIIETFRLWTHQF